MRGTRLPYALLISNPIMKIQTCLFSLLLSPLLLAGDTVTEPKESAEKPAKGASLTEAPPTPTIRSFPLSAIEALGKELYAQHLAIQAAFQALRENDISLANYPVDGWLVEKTDTGRLVYFTRLHEEKEYLGILRIHLPSAGNATIDKLSNEPLSAEQNAALKAMALALNSFESACTPGYRPALIPDPDGEGLLAYALAHNSDPNLIQIGGHHRFSISSDGRSIEQHDALFVDCLVLRKSSVELDEAASLSTHTFSHPLSPTPVEIHLFQSLLHNTAFSIKTPDGTTWKVEKSLISKDN